MMNRPNSKYYKRNRRVKWSNPLFVWLFVLVTALIMVPIQAAEPPADTAPTAQVQETEEVPTTPEEDEEIAQ